MLGQDNVEVDDGSVVVLDSHYIYRSQSSIAGESGDFGFSQWLRGFGSDKTTTSVQECWRAAEGYFFALEVSFQIAFYRNRGLTPASRRAYYQQRLAHFCVVNCHSKRETKKRTDGRTDGRTADGRKGKGRSRRGVENTRSLFSCMNPGERNHRRRRMGRRKGRGWDDMMG